MPLPEKELTRLRCSEMGRVCQLFGLLPHRMVLDNVVFLLEMRGQGKHTCRERWRWSSWRGLKTAKENSWVNYLVADSSARASPRSLAMARMLVKDADVTIPVKRVGALIGVMPRQSALDILLGAEV